MYMNTYSGNNYCLFHVNGTPHDEIIGNSNQPMIVVMYDVDESVDNRYYIMIEQQLLLDSNSFTYTLFLLLAVHYVFNLQYNAVVEGTLRFLQEFVCNVKDKNAKHSASYTSITTHLYQITDLGILLSLPSCLFLFTVLPSCLYSLTICRLLFFVILI